MRLGKVYINCSYVVDLDNHEMVNDAKMCLYEDLMNAVKYDELMEWIDIESEDELSKNRLSEDDIPSFLLEQE